MFIAAISLKRQYNSEFRKEWAYFCNEKFIRTAGPILSVFPALIVHSELKSVHPGFPVAFIF